MSALQLIPLAGPLDAYANVPGSKSITNRALVVAALADGRSRLSGALFADDTRHMIDALRCLGLTVAVDETACTIIVDGCGGNLPETEATLYCGNSGTTMRFCAALAATSAGTYRLEGTARMYERPIGPLVDALRRLGTRVEYLGEEGFPPIAVHSFGMNGGEIHLPSPPSSQMISALLMAAPYARDDVLIAICGPLVSAPYVVMTQRVVEDFGVSVLSHLSPDESRFVIAAPQRYTGRDYAIEPDASNASYFLAAPAVAGGHVTVQGLGANSIQGDARFVDVLEEMGCRIDRADDRLTVHGPATRPRGIDVDLNAMPDMVQTLAVVALFADGPTHIRNVANLRIKETDRISALATELARLGAKVEPTEDGLTIHPPQTVQPATIQTYDDHRMAMSFALAGLVCEGIRIEDPGCVSKTFPDFFTRWSTLNRTAQ